MKSIAGFPVTGALGRTFCGVVAPAGGCVGVETIDCLVWTVSVVASGEGKCNPEDVVTGDQYLWVMMTDVVGAGNRIRAKGEVISLWPDDGVACDKPNRNCVTAGAWPCQKPAFVARAR